MKALAGAALRAGLGASTSIEFHSKRDFAPLTVYAVVGNDYPQSNISDFYRELADLMEKFDPRGGIRDNPDGQWKCPSEIVVDCSELYESLSARERLAYSAETDRTSR